MLDNLNQFTPTEMWEAFAAREGSINKHLLTLYSLSVGVHAQRAIELGIGNSTRALRAAMQVTGGKLWSCDFDRSRFAEWLERVDEHWSLMLCPSTEFLRALEPPFDFALHDAAHDYWQVAEDLRILLPLMRRYSLVCIHDTQHSEIGEQMVHAINDATKGYAVSYVHLPFCYGLTILRLEESVYPPLTTPWNKGGKSHTLCVSSPLVPAHGMETHQARYWLDWLKQKARITLRKYRSGTRL
jgi:hypothetical protein